MNKNKIVNQKPTVHVGEELYMCQEGRSYGYSAEVKNAYTVIAVSDNEILVRECDYEWDNGKYYNSMPSKILPSKHGEVIPLHWSNTISGGCWWAYKNSTGRDYPEVAHFGRYEYYPYLD